MLNEAQENFDSVMETLYARRILYFLKNNTDHLKQIEQNINTMKRLQR